MISPTVATIVALMDLVPAVVESIESVAQLFNATEEELDQLRAEANARLQDSHNDMENTY
jgi:hypothetical protein